MILASSEDPILGTEIEPETLGDAAADTDSDHLKYAEVNPRRLVAGETPRSLLVAGSRRRLTEPTDPASPGWFPPGNPVKCRSRHSRDIPPAY
jgi:hypothetical protein